MDIERIAQAQTVAAKSLKANLRKIVPQDGVSRTVVAAGANRFNSVWTRDFCFAAGGLLGLGETAAVRDTLVEIVVHQRADGLFPRLLGSCGPITRFLRALAGGRIPLKAPLSPNFLSDHFVESVDSNALVAWTMWRYLQRSRDHATALHAMPALERGMAWYGRLEDGVFVVQPPFSDWKDTVGARRGRVFFTQLLRWQAMKAMSALWAELLRQDASETWHDRAETLRRKIQMDFWDETGGFYRDTLERALFSSDGNLAAIVWGFTIADQAGRILEALERLGLWTPWGPRAGQRYAWTEKGILARLALFHGCHDDHVWLWNSALALQVLHRLQRHAKRDSLVKTLCSRIIEDQEVGEVYRPESGKPVRTWLYRSEAPFTWSSAMLVEAFQALLVPPVRLPE